MRKKIVEECAKYGYEFEYEDGNLLSFRNPNVREELQLFHVTVSEELDVVSMALIIDLSSWDNAINVDLDSEEEIYKTIELWISKENLSEVEKYFLE